MNDFKINQKLKGETMNILKTSLAIATVTALAGCASATKPYAYGEVGNGKSTPTLSAECKDAIRDANLNNAMVDYIEKNKLANNPNWKGKTFTVPAQCKN